MQNRSYIQELKTTLKLALPIIIAQLGQMGFGIMDTAMVGALGPVPLGASAFVNSIYNVPLVFLAGVSAAISVLASQNFGAKNYKECGRALNNGLTYITLLSLGIILILTLFRDILSIFNQPAEVLRESWQYYGVIIWSLLPLGLFFVLRHFCDGVSKPSVPLFFLIIGLILNFILNYILIYGKFGFPAYGLYGAGIATLYARWILVVLLFIYIQKAASFEKFVLPFSLKNQSRAIYSHISKIGIPSGMQYVFECAAFVGAAIMMGWIGTNTLAAHQIAIQIASVTFMVALGFSFATSVRIGQLKGAEDFVGLKRIGISSFVFIATLMGLFGVVILLLRNQLPLLFIQNEEVVNMASQLLVIVFFFQIFDGTQAVGVSALRALEDVKVPTIITLTAYWVISMPLGYYLAFKVGLAQLGIWYALWMSLFLASILLILRFIHKCNKMIRTQNEIMSAK